MEAYNSSSNHSTIRVLAREWAPYTHRTWNGALYNGAEISLIEALAEKLEFNIEYSKYIDNSDDFSER